MDSDLDSDIGSELDSDLDSDLDSNMGPDMVSNMGPGTNSDSAQRAVVRQSALYWMIRISQQFPRPDPRGLPSHSLPATEIPAP